MKIKYLLIVGLTFCFQFIYSQISDQEFSMPERPSTTTEPNVHEKPLNLRGVAVGLPTTPEISESKPDIETKQELETNKTIDEIWAERLNEQRELGVPQIPLSSIPITESNSPEDFLGSIDQVDVFLFYLIIGSIVVIIFNRNRIHKTVILKFKSKWDEFVNTLNQPKLRNTDNMISQLERIKKLKKDGVISESEFNVLKKSILG